MICQLRSVAYYLSCLFWFSNILTISVPDEGYSRNTSCAINLLSTFLLKELEKGQSCLVKDLCLCIVQLVEITFPYEYVDIQ